MKISIIFALSFAGSVVVDFGCGSGALSLPLACLFLDLTFVCVDYKHESIRLLDQRTQAANLTNVSTWQVSKAMHFVLVIKCQHEHMLSWHDLGGFTCPPALKKVVAYIQRCCVVY
jgi:predicted RNA methylase